MRYNIEIHGTTTYYKKPVLLAKVPEISPYVQNYMLPESGLTDPTSVDALGAARTLRSCPKIEAWNADCSGACGFFEATAEIVRGELKQNRDGSKKDPNNDYNYHWTILDIDPMKNTTSERPASTTGSSKPSKISQADMVGLNRELATNDRTALMQAVAYNLPTPEEILECAERFSSWLNNRSVARFTSPTVQALQGEGAVVKEVRSKPSEPEPEPEKEDAPNILPKPSGIASREDLDKWIGINNVKPSEIKNVLSSLGYADSRAYLEVEGKDYATLAKELWDGLIAQRAGDLPW
tara:strand:+ start:1204 stop:2088 length:885 start_codon:yes stop_codon:yes gene_type:complete